MAQSETSEWSEPSSKPAAEPTRVRFSLISGLILMTVFATVSASLAHLVRAAEGDHVEIGRFVVITALSPLLLLAVTSTVFRIASWLKNR